MFRFIILLSALFLSGQSQAFPGSSLIHKVTGGGQHQKQPAGPGDPQQKKSFFGKIKSGASHLVSASKCTQAVCSDPYQFTPQKANYCLGTEGKARTNINCAKVFLSGSLAQNPAYSQAVHFAQIAMQKGAGGIGKLTGAVSGLHSMATCTAQKCGNPNMGRNDLAGCLGTPQLVQKNQNCATAYYNMHCNHLSVGVVTSNHSMEFCNVIAQARGIAHTGMMGTGGCHGILTYTMPPGGAMQPMGQTPYQSSYGGSVSANPYDTDGNPNTPY
jgi:hypothetical protein